jgi:glycosyltransferase involved in cell wall biosynthesis
MEQPSPSPDRKSAVFVGLARDCARHLPHVLDNIHAMAELFGKSAFVFAENDSRDQTRDILRMFAANRPGVRILNFDGIGKRLPERTRRLAFLRNQCLSAIRADKVLRGYDYLIVVDMDDANNEKLDLGAVARALRFLEADETRAGGFANSRGPFYDIWALREDSRCPGDAWEEVLDYATAHQVDDASAYRATFARRIFTLPPDAAPVPVSSAFGGLGLYKLRFALMGTYKGFKAKDIVEDGKPRRARWQSCEHVSFNQDIVARGGKLFILPYLCNVTTGAIEFNESFHRTLIF